jgi:regulatory protein
MRSPRKPDCTGKPRERPGPRPVTASYLRNAAMHYISGRAASAAMVRQTLERRAKRRHCVTSLDEPTRTLIDGTIKALQAAGLLDDTQFAEGRAATLMRRGLPRRRITAGLRLKGIDTATIEQVVGPEIDELAQARRYIQRKRLGPWRRGGMTPETRRKDLGALSRAGFSLSTAGRALDETETE